MALPNETEIEERTMTNRTALPSVWLTASEAAAYLKVKVRTLLLWTRQSKVKAYALSGTKRRVWRFRQADLDTALMESAVLASVCPAERMRK